MTARLGLALTIAAGVLLHTAPNVSHEPQPAYTVTAGTSDTGLGHPLDDTWPWIPYVRGIR